MLRTTGRFIYNSILVTEVAGRPCTLTAYDAAVSIEVRCGATAIYAFPPFSCRPDFFPNVFRVLGLSHCIASPREAN